MEEQRLELFFMASLIGILANPQRHAPPADMAKAALAQARAANEVFNAEYRGSGYPNNWAG